MQDYERTRHRSPAAYGGVVLILSVSRRTDIPALYSEWFFKRLQEGYVLVRNPMNVHQVSRVSLNPQETDCIVFWTKDPTRMLDNLHILKDYRYYFQVTITGYGKALEPKLAPKNEIIASFKKLSDCIGKERIIWRYDPIIATKEFDEEFHLREFSNLARTLSGYTERCVISFLDLYKKTERNLRPIGKTLMSEDVMLRLAELISPIAAEYGLFLETCSEKIDLLTPFGIRHGKCIDPSLISQIIGQELDVGKDPNQRLECGCVSSIDIGTYNSCTHGCIYCYANFSQKVVEDQVGLHNPKSPLLIGELGPEDKVIERKMKSLVSPQLKLF